MTIGDQYLSDVLAEFRKYKRLAERAVEQVDDEAFFAVLDPEANSMAILVKHMAGNMHSRWRDFLNTDGEKPDRNRDAEFIVMDGDTRESLMMDWEDGWQLLFDALLSLTADELLQVVQIRGEDHSVIKAINRQLTHYPYHVGQIVLLAKHTRCADWQTLSIPRGQSEQYNARMNAQPR